MRRKTKDRKPAYLDSTLSVDTRVRDLLGRMTIEEKVRQMSMRLIGTFVENGRVSDKAVREFFGGMSIGCLQDLWTDPKGSATGEGLPGPAHGLPAHRLAPRRHASGVE